MVVNPEGGDYRTVARAVTQGKFPPPSARNPSIPAELDALVMKAIAVKADDRFQTGESLRDAIQTELARLNPTISGDQLAVVLRGLFAEELQEERELVARMHEVDLAPFRDELTAATVSHTVTFARAPAAPPSTPALPEPVVEEVPLSEIEADRDTGEQLPRARGGGVLWLALVAMIFGAGIVVLLFKQTRPPAVTTAPPVTPSPVVTPPVVVPPPVVTPAPTPPPVVMPLAPAPQANAGEHHKHGHHDKSAHVAPHGNVTPEAVQAKFKKVRGEYGSFKSQYGGVLEERWNAIANEITYGRPGNDQAKFEKVDQMLDSLRHEMQKVRDGG
jgi:serine/threonine-protein kinase